jgi:ureidoglycolate hydrolase
VIGIAFNQLRVAALLNEGECYKYSQLARVRIRSQPPRVGWPITQSWMARHPESE